MLLPQQHTNMVRNVQWPHWHFCHLTFYLHLACIFIDSSTSGIQCQFESTQFQNGFQKFKVHVTFLLLPLKSVFLKIERVLNLAECILNLIFPWTIGYINVYCTFVQSIWSHWDLTFGNDFFLHGFVHDIQMQYLPQWMYSSIYHDDHNCTCCKSFRLSNEHAYHHPIQKDFIFIAGHFPFHTISACFSRTHSVQEIQLVKCEFYPHSTTENM